MTGTDLLDPLATGPLDDGPLDDDEPAEARRDGESSRSAITPREAWRRSRWPLAVAVVFVALAGFRAVSMGVVTNGYLRPDGVGGSGAGAVAELLKDRGVDVRLVDRPSGSRDVTVFLPIPGLVEPDVVAAADDAAELVIVSPPDEHAAATGAGVEVRGDRDVEALDPRCENPDATVAGKARLGGLVFLAPEGTATCYRSSFVQVERGGQRMTFLGSADFMTNDRLDEDGNAALALRLLSRQPTVEWVIPSERPEPEEQQSLGDLLPRGVGLLVAQLGVVVLLLAAWRARRLGPVVTEPLPVVVRAAEAVEGRARLYQSARARERAAEALRAGARDRLVRTLGLPPDAARSALVAGVTPRTRGRDATDVDTLLYGPPPGDDPALVRLAGELDSLYSEVRDL